MKRSLLDTTLNMLKERPRSLTLDKIAEDTGLPHRWLSHFASMDINSDPRVCRVETLYSYLAKRDLFPN